MNRAALVREELAYIARVQEKAERLTRLWEQGQLPVRVTHNDTKINNVLFDEQGLHATAIIDLDTVMPGLVGHDFGDGIRFCSNVVEEDCPNSELARCDLERFRAFTRGFLEQMGDKLTPVERSTMAALHKTDGGGKFVDMDIVDPIEFLGEIRFKEADPAEILDGDVLNNHGASPGA